MKFPNAIGLLKSEIELLKVGFTEQPFFNQADEKEIPRVINQLKQAIKILEESEE